MSGLITTIGTNSRNKPLKSDSSIFTHNFITRKYIDLDNVTAWFGKAVDWLSRYRGRIMVVRTNRSTKAFDESPEPVEDFIDEIGVIPEEFLSDHCRRNRKAKTSRELHKISLFDKPDFHKNR